MTLSNGNLDLSAPSASGISGTACSLATISTFSGKYYFEISITDGSTATVGICETDYLPTGSNEASVGPGSVVYYGFNGNVYNVSTSSSSYGSTFQTGDVISVAFDLDSAQKTVTFYKNNVSQGSVNISLTGDITPIVGDIGGTASITANCNFGQKPFKFPPPAGFQPLNAANVRPETVITRPDHYVGVKTYTGNASVNTISGYKFAPDFAWLKSRGSAQSHALFDKVRGSGNRLQTNTADAQDAYSSYFTGFTNDGFTLNNNSGINQNTDTLVAWAWKAGGNKNTFNVDDIGYASAAAAGLTGGTLNPTGASVGTRQGFSIIKYNSGGSTGNYTLSHGMGKTPTFIIHKQLTSGNWWVYHADVIDDMKKYLQLNSINGVATNSGNMWGASAPTDSVFGVRVGDLIGTSTDAITYLWADVPGLQKFGKFIGNASADGNFIELGFRPALVWIKPLYSYNGGASIVAQTGWYIYDNKRESFNPNGKVLAANASYVEEDNSTDIDFLSNGFKLRNTRAVNTTQGSIYCAWAEAPTFNLYGAQSNAR